MSSSEDDKARIAENKRLRDALEAEQRSLRSWRGKIKGTVQASRKREAMAGEVELPLEFS